ncbi:hypothetical protein MRX96_052184, partial [Rhipicephalus microplus]
TNDLQQQFVQLILYLASTDDLPRTSTTKTRRSVPNRKSNVVIDINDAPSNTGARKLVAFVLNPGDRRPYNLGARHIYRRVLTREPKHIVCRWAPKLCDFASLAGALVESRLRSQYMCG